MSWLRNHIRHFVVPGLKALAQARVPIHGQQRRYGLWGDPVAETKGVLSSDIKPLKAHLRPSKKCSHKEAGLVYTAVKSFFRNPEFHDLSHRILSECDVEHLLPSIHGNVGKSFIGPDGKDIQYSSGDVIHSIIKSSWRSLKEIAEGRIIILPGRDVWAWEVFARKNNYPTVFDPRVSRIFCSHRQVLEEACKEWDVEFSKALIFDTGFAGSIPKAISIATGMKVDYLLLSSGHNKFSSNWTQIFPNHKGSRSKVLCIEYFPKYFKTGTVVDGKPTQFVSSPVDFMKAAAFTIWLWHNRSPRFIKQYSPRKETQTEPDDMSDPLLSPLW